MAVQTSHVSFGHANVRRTTPAELFPANRNVSLCQKAIAGRKQQLQGQSGSIQTLQHLAGIAQRIVVTETTTPNRFSYNIPSWVVQNLKW